MFIRKRNLIALLQIAYAKGNLQAQIDATNKEGSTAGIELPAAFVEAQRQMGWNQ